MFSNLSLPWRSGGIPHLDEVLRSRGLSLGFDVIDVDLTRVLNIID